MNLEDLFTVAAVTAAINKLPAVPAKAGALGIFEEKGVTTTSVVIDEREGRLVLVPNTSRDGDPAPLKPSGRARRSKGIASLQEAVGEVTNLFRHPALGCFDELLANGETAIQAFGHGLQCLQALGSQNNFQDHAIAVFLQAQVVSRS
ncbi:Phage major capsid protein E [compost metagenome]